MILALLSAILCLAEDIPLEVICPIDTDRTIFVATLYRNQPNFYYFTVVYRFTPFRFERFWGKIAFTMDGATYNHSYAIRWIMTQYRIKLGLLLPEPRELFPFDLPTSQPKEFILIAPGKENVHIE
jgi:hypothetical protein